MPQAWRYRGQTIRSEQVGFLRQFIAAHRDSSRWKLSRQLCEASAGNRPTVRCVTWFAAACCCCMERAGQIELPPVRRHIRGQRRSARLRPEAVLIDTTPLALPLGELGPVEIQPVRRTADEPLFNSLLEQYHYLG